MKTIITKRGLLIYTSWIILTQVGVYFIYGKVWLWLMLLITLCFIGSDLLRFILSGKSIGSESFNDGLR